MIDRKSMFDHLWKNNSEVSNPKLKVNIAVIKQAFKEKHLTELIWTPSKYQLVDSLTKHARKPAEYLKWSIIEGLPPYDLDNAHFKQKSSRQLVFD